MLVEDLTLKSIDEGVPLEEAEAEAQVAALISALFLTNRGFVDLKQKTGRNGDITLRDLWDEEEDFATLSLRLNPKPKIQEVSELV